MQEVLRQVLPLLFLAITITTIVAERRKTFWKVPGGPGQWPVTQRVPHLHIFLPDIASICSQSSPPPRDPRKKDRECSEYSELPFCSLGAPIAGVFCEAAKSAAASSQGHIFRADDRSHFSNLSCPGLISIAGVF